MKIGSKNFDLKHEAYIMGILNVTPDSFSDGGMWNDNDKALVHVEKMIKDGAAIIDVGGESTRPGFVAVSESEEIERVAPIISLIKQNFDIAISVDTYKAGVASAAIDAGADMVNDIWGLRWDKDPSMAALIAKRGVPCVLMHNRIKPLEDSGFIKNFLKDVGEILKIADDSGINREQIILDPGIGFGKSLDQNLVLIKYLDELTSYKLPILLGTSRKSVIGKTLDLPVDQRLSGTIATTVVGRMKGARIFRVHDVAENLRALRMTEALLNADL